MPRAKTPVTFSRTGFDEPAINPALDFLLGETPHSDRRVEPPTEAERPVVELPTEAAEGLAPAPDPPDSDLTVDRASGTPVAESRTPASRSARALADPVVAPSHGERAKARTNMEVDADLWDRFKNAVVYLRLTLTDAVGEAIAEKLDELEREHGGAFPERSRTNLRPGRPLR